MSKHIGRERQTLEISISGGELLGLFAGELRDVQIDPQYDNTEIAAFGRAGKEPDSTFSFTTVTFQIMERTVRAHDLMAQIAAVEAANGNIYLDVRHTKTFEDGQVRVQEVRTILFTLPSQSMPIEGNVMLDFAGRSMLAPAFVSA
jgi:hypothetical protein